MMSSRPAFPVRYSARPTSPEAPRSLCSVLRRISPSMRSTRAALWRAKEMARLAAMKLLPSWGRPLEMRTDFILLRSRNSNMRERRLRNCSTGPPRSSMAGRVSRVGVQAQRRTLSGEKPRSSMLPALLRRGPTQPERVRRRWAQSRLGEELAVEARHIQKSRPLF